MRGRVVAGVLVGVALLFVLVMPGSNDPVGEAPSAPEAASGPTAPGPKPVVLSRKRTVFRRAPDVAPSAPVRAGSPASTGSAEPMEPVVPPPRSLDLDDLSDERRAAVMKNAMERMAELSEACGDTVDAPVLTSAEVSLDDRGLQVLELSTYEVGENEAGERITMLTDTPIPTALASCLEDHLWSAPWTQLGEGEVLSYALTMPFGED
ncbi:MAG: hypothetical protein R3F61_17305 [Myxococcota bacterium]